MKILRGLVIFFGAFAVLLVSARTILFAPSWCTSVLPLVVCKPIFAALFGGIGFVCCYLMMKESKQVFEHLKRTRKK